MSGRQWMALVALVSSLAACSGAPPPSPSPDPSPVVATATEGPIVVTLTLEGPPRNDAVSWASIRIENTGDEIVRWSGGGCGEPGGIFIDVTAAVDAGRADWPGRLGTFKRQALGLEGNVGGVPSTVGYIPEARLGKNIMCTADLRLERMGPGDVLSYRAGWDGRLAEGPAPVGSATVSAVFPMIGIEGKVDPNSFDSKPVRATIETNVVGSAPPEGMSPGLAIDAALSDEQFAAWVQAAPENTWINPNVFFADGVWTVGLFRMGDAVQMEMFGEVKVGADGKIVGRRFEQ